MNDAPATARIDKWLWQARFFKSRAIAARAVQGGQVRVNGERVQKAARAVGPGDVLTFPQGRLVRVVRIVALGHRRGPAAEARELYSDLQPDTPRESRSPAPDRNARREAIRSKRPPLE